MFSGELRDRAVDAARLQLEALNEPATFLSVHSVGGGTGSGLGCRATETLAEEFPDVFRANVVVAPHAFGEVVVQSYNVTLSLAHLAEFADAVLVLDNEEAYATCRGACRIDKPQLADLNALLARGLVQAALPKRAMDGARSSGLTQDLLALCAHPRHVLCSVLCAPLTSAASVGFTKDSWPALLRALGRQLSGAQGGLRLIGAALSLRGEDVPLAEGARGMLFADQSGGRPVLSLSAFAQWAENPVILGWSALRANDYARSAGAVCNGQHVLPLLARTERKARLLFDARAYVHQYAAHGVDEAQLGQALAEFAQIFTDYSNL